MIKLKLYIPKNGTLLIHKASIQLIEINLQIHLHDASGTNKVTNM
jgi:hypothetical protein